MGGRAAAPRDILERGGDGETLPLRHEGQCADGGRDGEGGDVAACCGARVRAHAARDGRSCEAAEIAEGKPAGNCADRWNYGGEADVGADSTLSSHSLDARGCQREAMP